jgi:hypothetical protein
MNIRHTIVKLGTFRYEGLGEKQIEPGLTTGPGVIATGVSHKAPSLTVRLLTPYQYPRYPSS